MEEDRVKIAVKTAPLLVKKGAVVCNHTGAVCTSGDECTLECGNPREATELECFAWLTRDL